MDLKDLSHPLKVKQKIQETVDTYSLVLDIPGELKDKFQYKAGQFVSFFLDINGQSVSRSYSLSSSPDTDDVFKITVKRVDGGLVSNYLIDDVNEGDTLATTPPAGLFVLPKNPKVKQFGFFAAGSGITPIISMIKSALATDPQNHCRLLYACRKEDSIIFYRELKELNQKYPEQFQYEYVLSQPIKPFDGMTGRLQDKQVDEFIARQSCLKESSYYLCGPEEFMATAQTGLEKFGVDKTNIHRESFTLPEKNNPTTADGNYAAELEGSVLIGNPDLAEKPETIHVELDGEHFEVKAVEGQSVLETLLEQGHNPPYSCMDGACMACMGKVTEGLVYQEDMGILTDDNTEIGECLTCKAIPASKTLKVSYEI